MHSLYFTWIIKVVDFVQGLNGLFQLAALFKFMSYVKYIEINYSSNFKEWTQEKFVLC